MSEDFTDAYRRVMRKLAKKRFARAAKAYCQAFGRAQDGSIDALHEAMIAEYDALERT